MLIQFFITITRLTVQCDPRGNYKQRMKVHGHIKVFVEDTLLVLQDELLLREVSEFRCLVRENRYRMWNDVQRWLASCETMTCQISRGTRLVSIRMP